MKLWTPQVSAVNAIVEDVTHNPQGSGLVYMATGTGKTVVAVTAAKIINESTWFLTHRDVLLKQAQKKFNAIWPEARVGVLSAKNYVPGDIMVASINVLQNRPDMLTKLSRAKLVILDEVHHGTCAGWQKVLGHVTGYILGLSATPDRHDGQSLAGVCEKTLFRYTLIDGIRDGYLCDLLGLAFRLDVNLDCAWKKGKWSISDLSALMRQDHIIEQVIDKWLEHAHDRKSAFFCVDVEHSRKVSMALCRRGIRATYIANDLSKEEIAERLSAYSRGSYQILVSCMMLAEGWDEPSVNCIVQLRPTDSEPLYIQIIGRGARGGKENCLIMDFVGNSRHKLVQLGHLLGNASTGMRPIGIADGNHFAYEKPFSLRAHITEAQAVDLLHGESPTLWTTTDDGFVAQISSTHFVIVGQYGQLWTAQSWSLNGYILDKRVIASGTSPDLVKTQAERKLMKNIPGPISGPDSDKAWKEFRSASRLAIDEPIGRTWIKQIEQAKAARCLDLKISYADIHRLSLGGAFAIVKKYLPKVAA